MAGALAVMPGCSQPQPQVEPYYETEVATRFNDAPPVVDSSMRYQLPVDTRIALAGNYGELRPNHFHGGLDFKTDQSIGHPVYSFADGYVRRVGINAYGYGLVLYVEHPEMGLTSVYGHLDTFNKEIWKKVRERQVAEELNNCDITFGPEDLPVKRGEVIAKSGNTGSSGGPHVHFELRNIPDDDDDICYDPQMFFLRELKDTQAPRISHLYLYPQRGEGLANGKTTRQMSTVSGRCATTGGEGGTVNQPFTAWGKVGLALKAYDYMDGQSNKYGVKELRLMMRVDDPDGGEPRYQLLYHFKQDAFRFSETRYTNSLTDYAAWVGQKSMIMKSFIEPGNLLQQVDPDLGNGIVNIDEERNYHFIYELEDAHGNLTSLDFDVKGVRPAEGIPSAPAPEGIWVEALTALDVDSAGCHLQAPSGVFYTDVDLRFKVADKAMATRTVTRKVKNKKGKMVNQKRVEEYEVPCVSKVYTVGRTDIPMHTYMSIAIDVPADYQGSTQQLYLTNLDGSGAVSHSRYVEAEGNATARVTGQVREAGRYVVRRDEKGPEVSITRPGWQRMQIEVGDAGSGLKQFKVLIDGKFVPFNMDNTGHYFGEPCNYGIAQGRNHKIEITAVDRCGNETHLNVEKNF